MACARRGDMALFGDLATIDKMVLVYEYVCVAICVRCMAVTFTVRARIHKLTLVGVCNDSNFSYLVIVFKF